MNDRQLKKIIRLIEELIEDLSSKQKMQVIKKLNQKYNLKMKNYDN